MSTSIADWQRWLRARVPAYLMRDARGEPRPPDAVARGLARLAGSPRALERLAAAAVLTDPVEGAEELVLRALPRYLESPPATSALVLEEGKGMARGRVRWGRTLVGRARSGDPTWRATAHREPAVDTLPLEVARWWLEQVQAAAATLGLGDVAASGKLAGDRLGSRVPLLVEGARRLLAHAALRERASREPRPEEAVALAHSRHDATRRLGRAVVWQRRLLPTPAPDTLARSLERSSFAPLEPSRQLEVYALLVVIEALDRLLPGFARAGDLIAPEREAVATWWRGDTQLRVFFDQTPEQSAHAAALAHYLGQASRLRPDLRLELRRGERRAVLYVDAKHSHDPGYLAESHLKLLGYAADDPGARAAADTRAVLLCPGAVRGSPRARDPVVVVSASSCGAGGALDEVLARFLR